MFSSFKIKKSKFGFQLK